jgi:hypothetical protein
VHRDHHIEVAKALYSIPGDLIGRQVQVRADRTLVQVYLKGAHSRGRVPSFETVVDARLYLE